MVPVSIKSMHSTHTESPLHFETTKPESQIVKARRNVFVLWVILRLGR